MDLWDVDIRRMMPFQVNRSYLRERVSETLGLLYADHFPYRQVETSRSVKRSPIHHRLEEKGCLVLVRWPAGMGQLVPSGKCGGQGMKPAYEYSWKRQNWFDYNAAEHKAIRNHVGLFDMSSFGKIMIMGKDAEAVLQKIACNNVAVEPGKIVYTQFLNSDGGIEADVTITWSIRIALLLLHQRQPFNVI